MQKPFFDPSLSWPNLVYVAVAGFLGWIGNRAYKWVQLWLNRNKPAAEIDESQARTAKTFAEARKINIQADTELNAIIERLHLRIDQMQIGIDGLRDDRDDWKQKAELLETQRQVDEHYIKRLTAANELGITLAELDRVKPHSSKPI
jgi:hypothetical protein